VTGRRRGVITEYIMMYIIKHRSKKS